MNWINFFLVGKPTVDSTWLHQFEVPDVKVIQFHRKTRLLFDTISLLNLFGNALLFPWRYPEEVIVQLLLLIRQGLFGARKPYRQLNDVRWICWTILVNVIVSDAFPRVTFFGRIWINNVTDSILSSIEVLVVRQHVLMDDLNSVLIGSTFPSVCQTNSQQVFSSPKISSHSLFRFSTSCSSILMKIIPSSCSRFFAR